MGTKFFRSLIAGLSLMLSFSSVTVAGDYVHRVIIANEGGYDYNNMVQLQPTHLAAYDPATKTYTVFDTVSGVRFITEVIISGDYIFLAADTALVKYDRYTLQRLGTQSVKGIRGIATWNDQLLVTRGEVGGLPTYFQVYNISDLSLDYELTPSNGPAYASQDIEVVGDKAYFVINNAFEYNPPNQKGFIGIVDLNTHAYSQVDLGVDGINPDNLMREGNKLYTVNNKHFDGSSISVYDIQSGNVTTTNLSNVTTGCGTSALFVSNIWYQQNYPVDKMYSFNPQSQQISDSIIVNRQFYGLEIDPVNNYLYATSTVQDTDYIPISAMAYIYSSNRVVLDSFEVGFFARSMAFDVRKTTDIAAVGSRPDVAVYPNPVSDELRVSFNGFDAKKMEVFDVNGKQITSLPVQGVQQTMLPTNTLPAGVYYIILTSESGVKAGTKFVRE